MARLARNPLTFAALILVACATKRPEKWSNAGVDQPPVAEPDVQTEAVVLSPRPEVDLSHLLPDFHDELRWPLTSMNHPSLEPRFAIAQAFAQPGVTWTDLCRLGAQNRYGRDKELLSYLRGWCGAVSGDVDVACGNLAPLVGSAHLGVDAAVKIDLANILVDQGSVDNADHWINKYRIRDVEILDLLAANFAEVGKLRDAHELNHRLIENDIKATQATQCRRMVREITLTESRLSPFIQKIHELATQAKVPDPTCLAMDHKLRCWVEPGMACEDYFRDVGIDANNAYLMDAYYNWPEVTTTSGWWKIVTSLSVRLPDETVASFIIAAVENAIRARGGCEWTVYMWLRETPALRQSSVRIELATRLTALEHACRFWEPQPLSGQSAPPRK